MSAAVAAVVAAAAVVSAVAPETLGYEHADCSNPKKLPAKHTVVSVDRFYGRPDAAVVCLTHNRLATDYIFLNGFDLKKTDNEKFRYNNGLGSPWRHDNPAFGLPDRDVLVVMVKREFVGGPPDQKDQSLMHVFDVKTTRFGRSADIWVAGEGSPFYPQKTFSPRPLRELCDELAKRLDAGLSPTELAEW